MDGGIQPALLLSGCAVLLTGLGFITGQLRQKRIDASTDRSEGADRAEDRARMAALETALDHLRSEILDKLAYRDLEHRLIDAEAKRVAAEAELAKYRGAGGPKP